MSVYVDAMRAPLQGRPGLLLCHMIADTHKELLAMGEAIGMRKAWLQKEGHWDEHYDVGQTKRATAVRLGACQVSQRELVRRLLLKKPGPAAPLPPSRGSAAPADRS